MSELTLESIRGILPRGGTILGSSRTNPYKRDDGVNRSGARWQDFRIDGLMAIGGEDTLGVAAGSSRRDQRHRRPQDDRQRPGRDGRHLRL